MRERKQLGSNTPRKKMIKPKSLMRHVLAIILVFVLCNQVMPDAYAINQVPKAAKQVTAEKETEPEKTTGTGETKNVWEASVKKTSLTGICWTKDVVKIARTQIGYEQKEMDKQCYSRYGEWFGSPNSKDWDAMFVSFCLSYAKVPVTHFPQIGDSEKWIKELKRLELFSTGKDAAPVIGDLAFYQSEKGTAKVGIIANVKENGNSAYSIRIIGKTDKGTVSEVTYESTNKRFLGYGCLGKKEDQVKRSYHDKTLSVMAKASRLADTEELMLKAVKASDKLQKTMDEAIENYAKENGKKKGTSSELLQMQVITENGGRETEPKVQFTGQYKGTEKQKVCAVKVNKAGDQAEVVPLETKNDTMQFTISGASYIEFVTLEAESASNEEAKEPKEPVNKGEIGVPSSSIELSYHANRPLRKASGSKVNSIAKAATINKQIDWLGDGVKNEDAEETGFLGDKYRLYLDATGIKQTKPVDVLFVVDRSGSMNYDMATGNEPPANNPNKYKNTSRIKKLQDILLGANGQTGLLDAVKNMNPENNAAIISFAGDPHGKWVYDPWVGLSNWQQEYDKKYKYTDDASVALNWGESKDFSLIANGGTNYTAAYMLASDMFDKLDKDNGHDKVMIFLSDGVPTLYINDKGQQLGTGSNQVASSTVEDNFDRYFSSKHSEVAVSTIGISAPNAKDFDTTVLKYMAQTSPKQTHGSYYMASGTTGIVNALNGILNIANVSISDTLSEYVDLDGENANIQVTAQSTQNPNDVTILWKGTLNNAGAVVASDRGTGKIKSVTYDKETKQVKVTFADDYYLSEDYKVTLSFNVKVSETAKEYLASGKGYPNSGRQDTDYKENKTSSKQLGFYSNKEASLTYTVEGKEYKDPYPHPVIQASTLFLEKQSNKGNPIGGVEFTLYKANGEWTKDGEAVGKAATTEDGNLSFSALAEGNYLLYETKAADGYLLPENPWHVTVKKDGTMSLVDSAENKVDKDKTKYRIINYEIYVLPSSGGIGTYPFTIAGIAIVTVAVGLAYDKRRKRHRVN